MLYLSVIHSSTARHAMVEGSLVRIGTKETKVRKQSSG
jgi:hypothetical protein